MFNNNQHIISSAHVWAWGGRSGVGVEGIENHLNVSSALSGFTHHLGCQWSVASKFPLQWHE